MATDPRDSAPDPPSTAPEAPDVATDTPETGPTADSAGPTTGSSDPAAADRSHAATDDAAAESSGSAARGSSDGTTDDAVADASDVRRLTRRAVLAVLLPAVPTAAAATYLFAEGRPAAAVGLLLGHAAGLGLGLSWVLAGLHAPGAAALAHWPLRFVALIVLLALGVLLGADPTWLSAALFLSVVYALIVTVTTLTSPTAATDPDDRR